MLVAAIAAAAPNASPLDVQMTLSSDRILLGEPLWVDVRVTNRSSAPLSVDMGSACYGRRPLVVDVPDAEPRVDKERSCGDGGLIVPGGVGSGCFSPGAQLLAPGATLTKRYVFDGAFRITQPGYYRVRLTKPLRYGRPEADYPNALPESALSGSARVETTLEVMPADPQELLRIERALAARAMATVPPLKFPSHPDVETMRRVVNAHHTAETIAFNTQTAIVDGLVAYPAEGMEPFFEAWLRSKQADYRAYQAQTALYHLNTPAARANLAKIAADSFNPNAWIAIRYLGLMGDATYLPLLERASNYADPAVRQQATSALGILGGEAELPELESLVRAATTDADRYNAITALGNTGTLKAIPFLIDLLDEPATSSVSSSSLYILTHHQLTPAENKTPHAAATAWRTWWAQNQATARAYRPWDDCPT